MTEKLPTHIKNNFIYRRTYTNVRTQEMNAVFLFVGDIGKGKSTGAIRFAEDLDPDFNIERICFTTEEFLNVLKNGDSKGKLKVGSVIIFDEAAGSEESADSRNALTHTNKIMSWLSTISRAKRWIIIYVCPFLSQLDKRIRLIGITGIVDFKDIDRRNKRSYANFYWSYGSSLSDKVLTPKPRLRDKETGEVFKISHITLPLPKNKELLKAYKKKKLAFIDGKVTDWYKVVASMKKKQAKRKIDLRKYLEKANKMGMQEFRSVKGKISVALIMTKLGLSEKQAKHLKTVLLAEAGE